MTEDPIFNAFLKAKLEEDVDVPAVRLPAFRPWTRRLLVAASLAGVCCCAAWFALKAPTAASAPADPTENTIALLSECYELDDDIAVTGEDFAETLLAWQDVPYLQLQLD